MHPALLNPSFSSVDRHFANLLARKARTHTKDSIAANTHLILLFARLSQALGQQNTCLTIDDQATIAELVTLDCVSVVNAEGNAEGSGEGNSDANKSSSTSDETQAAINRPLVLFQIKENLALLYTQRFYQYEKRIARSLMQRNRMLPEPEHAIKALQAYLTDADDHFQKVAAIQAVCRQLTIISGGPGTGKTSTVVKILAGLIAAQPDLRIQLAAPTGKAAMRLSSSIQTATQRLGSQTKSALPAEIPSDVSTLHRLLGVRGDGQSFLYNRHHPLPIDVLILDEASMIDLVMFDRVLQALNPHVRIIVLGDPAQLPSVDSGKVMLDITRQGEIYSTSMRNLLKEQMDITLEGSDRTHHLADAHCSLKTSYRFNDDEGIGQLAHQLRLRTESESHATSLSNTLRSDTLRSDTLLSKNEQVAFIPNCIPDNILKTMSVLYQPFLDACQSHVSDADELLDLFDRARLLTPVREGALGVTQLNEAFEQRHFDNSNGYYHGRPIMIMKNHYALRLFNGDIGVCVQRDNKVEVAFRTTDGQLEYYLPSRLPQHETCFVMTVHKSQGSEFDEVCLVLPTTDHDEFINRELVYTGITRAKSKLSIFTEQLSLPNQSSERTSGLARMLTKHEISKPKVQISRNQLDLF